MKVIIMFAQIFSWAKLLLYSICDADTLIKVPNSYHYYIVDFLKKCIRRILFIESDFLWPSTRYTQVCLKKSRSDPV